MARRSVEDLPGSVVRSTEPIALTADEMARGAGAGGAVVQGRLSVAGAALVWSSAGVLQRALTADVQTQIVGRAAFAFATVLAFVLITERRRTFRSFRCLGWAGLGYALAQAVSSAAFMAALSTTSVANVLVLQATAPLLAAGLGRIFLDEQVSRGTWLATLAALGGVGMIVGGPGGGLSLGLVFGLAMALSLAARIVLARGRPEISMIPASCLGQLILVVCFAPFAHLGAIGPNGVSVLAALGVGQGLGSVLLSVGAPLIPAVEGGLLSLVETPLGPLWVWLGRGEGPSAATLAGGLVILASVVVGTVASRQPASAPEPADAPAHGQWR